MEYKMILSANARLGLLDILDYYLAHGSLQRTIKVESSINQALAQITKRPFANKIYENTKTENGLIRKAVVHKIHIIIYEIMDNHIHIIDIFDGRRNPELFKY